MKTVNSKQQPQRRKAKSQEEPRGTQSLVVPVLEPKRTQSIE
jgi:hypothetical protein